jgi:ATP-dependent helicase/nuclease subunit A
MSSELRDSAAREAVRDLGRTFFVEASAGTGKTRLLCDRALEALLTPGYDPAWLVAITFTEKAAAELSARLRAALEEWTAGHPADEQAARALERFDQAHVSTIHSFAASLLREMPVEAAVDPAFEVADDVAAGVLFEAVWEEWLAAEADRRDGPEPWAELWSHFGVPRVDCLEGVVATLVAERDVARVEGYDDTSVDLGELRSTVAAALARFDEVRDQCRDPEDACYRAFSSLGELARAADAGDVDEVCRTALKAGGNKRNWKPAELKDELNDNYLKPVGEALERVCDARRRVLLPPLIAWLKGAAEAFERRKDEAGALDFHDLLLRAARLLARRNGNARQYFQRRFRHVLVDEFQDTDPLQVELIFYLAEEGVVARDWRDAALVPGKLFVVGDPKQSIYRFRRADIEVYEAARDAIVRSGGEVLQLTDNFRAAPGLVSFVNESFEAVFGAGEPPFQPAYGVLVPSPQTRERQAGAPAAKLLAGPAGPFVNEGEAAEAVAALVRRAVDDAEFQVYDKEEGSTRAVAFRDFALLLRTRTRVWIWEAAFERWGVPFYTLGGRTFYVRPEVKALAAAARALDNPADEPALVATLVSPLFSFTADELLRLKLADGKFDYREEVPAGAPAGLAGAFATLKELHDRRGERPPSATLAELAAGTRLLTTAALWGDGPRAVANVRKVLASARRYAEAGGVGLRGFARWLAEMAAREEAEHESPALDVRDDFVGIMTVHGAKGLEFNAVVFGDWARRSKKTAGESAFVDRATGLVHARVGSERGGTQLLTPGYEAAAEREILFAEAEERRLDYVAATRARDLLLLPHMAEAGENSLAEALAALPQPPRSLQTLRVDPAAERSRVAGRKAGEIEPPDFSPAYEAWDGRLDETLGAATEPQAVVAAAALAHMQTEDERDEEPGLVPRPEALKLGSALHAVMEEVDLAGGEGVDELAAEKCDAEGLPAKERGEVAAWARACLETAPVREAAASPAAYREMPFAVVEARVVVTGKVDLAYRAADGLVVADYKTDAPGEGPAREEYRDQLAVYAAALARATGERVARAHLIFPREEEGRRVVTMDDGDALAERGEYLLKKAPGAARMPATK